MKYNHNVCKRFRDRLHISIWVTICLLFSLIRKNILISYFNDHKFILAFSEKSIHIILSDEAEQKASC